MSKFQRIFKNLREQKNMTQEELAKALGVSKSTIGMYERGDREPNFEKLEVISYTINIQHLLSLVKLLNPRRIHRNVRL